MANTTMVSATSALVMNCLEPLRTHEPLRRVAVVDMAAASEPLPGSVSAQAAMPLPEARDGTYCCFCSSLPKRAMVSSPRPRCAARVTLAATSARAISSMAMEDWRNPPPLPP